MTGLQGDLPVGYGDWLAELKSKIRQARLRASLAVNSELIGLYWRLGRDILDRQARDRWGGKVVERLAMDLRAEFPEMRGLSRANLLYMRAFAEAWPDSEIVQRVVGQLPWGQNIELLAKLKDPAARLWYAEATLNYGWSRPPKPNQSRTLLSMSRPHRYFASALNSAMAVFASAPGWVMPSPRQCSMWSWTSSRLALLMAFSTAWICWARSTQDRPASIISMTEAR